MSPAIDPVVMIDAPILQIRQRGVHRVHHAMKSTSKASAKA